MEIVDGLCGARTRRGGSCGKTAGWGTSHPGVGRCRLHGGASPNAEVAGVVQLARLDMARWAAPLAIDPWEALLQLIEIAAGEVAYATERVAMLEEHELVGPVVTTVERQRREEGGAESATKRVKDITTGPPAEHIWRTLQHEAMDRLRDLIKLAGTLNIAERRVRLAELEGQLLVEIIRGILGDLGVLDHPEAPTVVRRHLALASSRRLQLAAGPRAA